MKPRIQCDLTPWKPGFMASGRVLRPDGSAVDGLYAAGRSAAGLCSRSYVSGLSLADCVFSGRRAGHHAAHLSNPLAHQDRDADGADVT